MMSEEIRALREHLKEAVAEMFTAVCDESNWGPPTTEEIDKAVNEIDMEDLLASKEVSVGIVRDGPEGPVSARCLFHLLPQWKELLDG